MLHASAGSSDDIIHLRPVQLTLCTSVLHHRYSWCFW